MAERTAVPRFGYVDTPVGQVHFARMGHGVPVLCIHQTPRSWDEFREIQASLADDFDVIAMDLPGMGGSPSPTESSIEIYADAAAGLLRGLEIDKAHVVGHHTGGVVALRLAASAGALVQRLVLSSTPLVDAEARAARATRPDIDAVEFSVDGQHLQRMWERRAAFYPTDRPDIQARYVLDALRVRDPELGHHAVAAYQMEHDIAHVTQPTLIVRHAADPYASPETARLHAALPHADLVHIDHGMVPLEYAADAFVEAMQPFLSA